MEKTVSSAILTVSPQPLAGERLAGWGHVDEIWFQFVQFSCCQTADVSIQVGSIWKIVLVDFVGSCVDVY